MNARLTFALAAAAALTAASVPAFAAETTIYLQRTASGSAVLTDRPQPLAVTERSWQVEREDPVAAQQRAAEVRRHADAVSARIARSMELQQMRAEFADRDRGGPPDRDADRARDDDVYGGGYLISPYESGFRGRHDRRGNGRHDGRGYGRDRSYPPPGDSRRNEYIGSQPQFDAPRTRIGPRHSDGGRHHGAPRGGRGSPHSSGGGSGRG